MDFVKIDPEAPEGFYEFEAAGLQWLAVDGGVPVVPLLEVSPGRISVHQYDTVEPTEDMAYEFGARLAQTHKTPSDWFGVPPDGWSSDGFVGHVSLPMAHHNHGMNFAEYFAEYRIEPFLRQASMEGIFDVDEVAEVAEFMDVVVGGSVFDHLKQPGRIHGDLWAGNIVWAQDQGGVLVDPAAHGGYGESDLAMLQLFGCPHFSELLLGYEDAEPLPEGWEMRFLALQVHPLLVHALFFGEAYGDHVLSAVRRFI